MRLTEEAEKIIRAKAAEWKYRGIGDVVEVLLAEIDALRDELNSIKQDQIEMRDRM